MKETFEKFSKRVPNFSALSQTDKVCYAAWYLHSQGEEYITASAINALFNSIHAVPPHTSVYLRRLSERKPPVFLKNKSGFRLENAVRRVLDSKLAQSLEIAAVSALLSDLVTKLGDSEEAVYLEEALRCYSVRAFRASIVMAWNLAYDHFIRWLISDCGRIKKFNESLAIKYPKKALQIANLEDFSEMKEFEAIETACHARLINKNVSEILKEKLKKRNAAAHPSGLIVTQAQADDVITDLVNNIVLKL